LTFSSVCTGWAKIDDARYHRRQFPLCPWVRTRPLLMHGRVVDPLTRPNFGKLKKSVTDVSAMSRNILVIAFHFSPLNVHQTCFHCRTVDSPCTLFNFTQFYLFIEVHRIKSKDRNDIL